MQLEEGEVPAVCQWRSCRRSPGNVYISSLIFARVWAAEDSYATSRDQRVCGGAVATPQFRRTVSKQNIQITSGRARLATSAKSKFISRHFSSRRSSLKAVVGRAGWPIDRRTAGRAGVSVTPRPPWSIATVASDHARLPPGSLPAAGRPPSQLARIVEGNSINNGL